MGKPKVKGQGKRPSAQAQGQLKIRRMHAGDDAASSGGKADEEEEAAVVASEVAD